MQRLRSDNEVLLQLNLHNKLLALKIYTENLIQMIEADKLENDLNDFWKIVTSQILHDESDINGYVDGFYHYTNSDGLLGIMNSQKLWATYSTYLNDSQEIKHGLELAEKIIVDFKKKTTYPLSNEILNGIKERIYKYSDEIYIACFSENGDLLSQWKGYGSYGEGVSIKLDPRQLLRQKRKFPFVNIAIKKVIYEINIQNEIIASKIDFTLEQANKILREHPRHEDEIINASIGSAAYYIRNMALRFKNNAFSEEKEWRAIYSNNSHSEEGLQSINFRGANSEIVPYIELDICPSAGKKDWSLPILEIIVGAKQDFQRAEKSIILMCKHFKIPLPKISRSTIPLR